jgi:hypothetical protein
LFTHITGLDKKVQDLIDNGYAANTSKTYRSGIKKYFSFCHQFGINPVPASETNLMRYIAFLSNKYNPRSIPVYMAAVRAFHINTGMTYPDQQYRAKVMIRGLQRGAPPPDQKEPISLNILAQMYQFIDFNSFDGCMLWAAMTTAFFGCLRVDELLRLSDVTFHVLDDGTNYCQISVTVAKCDNNGFTRVIGCSGSHVCAFCALSYYLLCYNRACFTNNLLFVNSTGAPLTHSYFVKYVKSMVATLGLNPASFSGHSFRIGCASTAGLHKFREWEIQLLGGWKSTAYKRYVRSRTDHVARFAARLARGAVHT